MKRIHFFATPADIVPVLQRFAANAPIFFTEASAFPSPNRAAYGNIADIPNPGISTHETGRLSKPYLVSMKDTPLRVRTYVTNDGEKYWSLDNGFNEDTIVLRMAGLWPGDILLPGIVDTMHDTPVAQQLMKWFQSALKKEGFTKVDLFWLGKEALQMLRDGKRLPKNAVQSPPEYDLKLV
jgi:hypothetical protein